MSSCRGAIAQSRFTCCGLLHTLLNLLVAAGALDMATSAGGPSDAAAVLGFLRHDQAAAIQHGAGVLGAHFDELLHPTMGGA